MRQVQVTTFGEAPTVHEIPASTAPAPDELQLRVLATGIHQLVRSRAAGKHYSAKGLPHIPGIDGIGEDLITGTKYYFTNMSPQGGTLQDVINVKKASTVPLSDSVKTKDQAVQIAGLMNPLMASWMAYAQRIDMSILPKEGFTVLVIGATGVSGKVAVPTSRHFGAKTIIGVARDTTKLSSLNLDGTLELATPPSETNYQTLLEKYGPIDIVLDFLYGDPALAFFNTYKGSASRVCQYVQIGSVAGLEIAFPAAVLRSKNLKIMGTGPGSWGLGDHAKQMGDMAGFLAGGEVQRQEFVEVGIDDVEGRWGDGRGERMVVVL